MPKRRSRGEGTIYQRPDGLWCAQIVLPDGRRKAKSSKSQKVARDWLQGQRQAIRDQVWTSNDSLTVEEFLGRYIKDVATPSVRARTLETYSWFTRIHI